MGKNKNVTIQMVADRAGVAKSTVSRVISGSPRISEKTRKKVICVMEELNYHPSAIARSLANRISKNVGLVLPSDEDFFLNPFFQKGLRAIVKTANLRGYDVVISYDESGDTKSIERLVNANKIDGAILMRSIINDSAVNYLRDKSFPFVLIGKSLKYDDVYTVDTDNVVASEKLTRLLIQEGCKKIGFIGGDSNTVVTIDRYRGYLNELERNNLEVNKNIIQENEFNELNGYASMKAIIESDSDIDGIVITDDLIFNGAIEYLYELGKEPRVNLAIATFGSGVQKYPDNIKVFYADVNSVKIGEQSCEKLIDILENKKLDKNDMKQINLIDIIDYTIK
ncbi:LacI family DNA-binding transcriptional regulator [Peptostreptococcus faecalis]|uniref:LacI family DNA-binding transcriptional regulator n=1 Tax=Peptostreptococcus faecalis TaxID=2045015 RepID=UPI000C79E8D8|nr:LacI family DNA-binding transcriptional regulator [Peptostreptococcus faecalis]